MFPGNHEKKVTEGLVRYGLSVVPKDRFVGGILCRMAQKSGLSLRRHLVLFELAIGHFVGPDAQHLLGEFQLVDAQRHPATKSLPGLRKFLGRTESSQAACEILKSLRVEVTISIFG